MNPALPALREVAVPGCFYCGVDSTQYVIFFAVVIGSGLGAALIFLVWSALNGDFRESEKPKYDLFNLERKQ